MNNGSILIVEDEEQVRTLIVRLLQKRGYSVLQAENGRRALEIARQDIDSISLVITDVIMPEMGAAPLLAELRRMRGNLPFLCMTGYTRDEVANSEGLQDARFLEKPFTPNTLLAEVEAILKS